jgi:pheromone alpha factor receptor
MSSSSNSTFNPYTQPITFYKADGVTTVTVLLSDINAGNFYNTACSINYSAQMGACFVMFFVVFVLTKESKRRSAIFILNILSLLLGFLRALLLALYFVGPWSNIYPSYSLDFSYIPRSAYATSIAGVVIPLLMTTTVNMSLILQAYIVCKNMSTVYRHIVVGLSCSVFLLAVGFRFAEMVTNSISIMSSESYYAKEWIQTGTLATETSSIWFFSIIFTGKLVWTLVTRRIMGWKQWSGVRILAAMGGCTMVIPGKCSSKLIFESNYANAR